jgi:hypothetical protein
MPKAAGFLAALQPRREVALHAAGSVDKPHTDGVWL